MPEVTSYIVGHRPEETPLRVFRRCLEGARPARYAVPFGFPLAERVQPLIVRGTTILDVGGGRRPLIPPEVRPPEVHYVGLDVSAEELERAAEGSYDAIVASPLELHQADLEARFDLIVSWSTLEHVSDLRRSVRNLHAYLRPGGTLFAYFAARTAPHALLNRLLPDRFGELAMERLLGRPPDTVFKAQYDACTHAEVRELFAAFDWAEVYSHYTDADYFRFSKVAEGVLLAYEAWAMNQGRLSLASHLTVLAGRSPS